MRRNKVRVSFRDLRDELKRTGQNGLPLRLKLFVFFLLFLTVVMTGILIILMGTGTFRAGVQEHQRLLENELAHFSQDVSQVYGSISLQGVALSQDISDGVEAYCLENNLTNADWKRRPELLEPLLERQLSTLLGALEKTKSSGVFVILDATVNPDAPNAAASRSGLFIKNMEPNIVNSSFPTIRFLRGPASISRRHSINLLPQWQMEFNTEADDYYQKTLSHAAGSTLPLSRLYYWTPPFQLSADNEEGMLCCVPLVDSQGEVFGVCGFEVSAMLFKLSNTPDNNTYTRIFCMLAPFDGDCLDASRALFAGNYSVTPSSLSAPISIRCDGGVFNTYRLSESTVYSGLHQQVRLYPVDSVYAQEQWAIALMMPERDLSGMISAQNQMLFASLAILMVLSIIASLWISRRYISPILEALNLLKSQNPSEMPKTRIPEIDDLIEFLSAQDTAPAQAGSNPPATAEGEPFSSTMFQNFVKNIETLSPAERAVFNLYMEGYTAKEIADILCLSINTIKTHNRRIYMKLNVTSRKELMVYVQMMAEASSQSNG